MTLLLSRRSLLGASLALPAAACVTAPPTSGPGTFTHGVASGDPRQTSVTLWTRYVSPGEARLRVEVATDANFSKIIASSSATASPTTDFCARAVATGLPSNRWLWYRFKAPDGAPSPVGRTRTLPEKGVDSFRLAVFSCSNATAGWFNAYAHAAAREDIDLAVHLGDYIYEGNPSNPMGLERHIGPGKEIIALADYRQRYATYREDPDLRALHARLPMISVWDDHETANNSWMNGAEAHDPAKDGDWAARKKAGIRANREWLPMSDKWWDAYRIGDLATLFRLETRLAGRSEQLEAPLAKIVRDGGPDLRARLQAFKDGPLASSSRSMMGPEQERWLADALKSSVNSGERWQILANQVIVGQTLAPAFDPRWLAPGSALSAQDEASNLARKIMTEIGLPYSLDKWDGYPAARTRLYEAARAARANIVTLTGDSHNAWAYDLGDKAGQVGVEFAGQSVSSNGAERRYTGDILKVAADYCATNPQLKWMDAGQRGYFTLDIRRDRVEADYVFVAAKDGRSAVSQGHKLIAAEYGARKLAI